MLQRRSIAFSSGPERARLCRSRPGLHRCNRRLAGPSSVAEAPLVSSVEQPGDDTHDGRGRPVQQKKSNVNSAYECVRLHPDGRVAESVWFKRRNLLHYYTLDPRDLRRIDPHLQFTSSSPTMYVKENALLVQLAGVRLIITKQDALLLDPHSDAARQFLSEIIPKLQISAGLKFVGENIPQSDSDGDGGARPGAAPLPGGGEPADIPFELDVLEAALHVAVAKMEGELERAQERVTACLERLPRDITPQNLDDLRRAKSALVELESKSDAYREMLEDIMDDSDELKDFNLSSRVDREERRKRRARGRLERELDRQRSAQESSRDAAAAARDALDASRVGANNAASVRSASDVAASAASPPPIGPPRGSESAADIRRQRGRAEIARQAQRNGAARDRGGKHHRARNGSSDIGHMGRSKAGRRRPSGGPLAASQLALGRSAPVQSQNGAVPMQNSTALRPGRQRSGSDSDARSGDTPSGLVSEADTEDSGLNGDGPAGERHNASTATWNGTPSELEKYDAQLLDRIGDYQTDESDGDGTSRELEDTDVMQELRALYEAEEEEQELQEVEDLLEYYLQRHTSIQTEAERLLAGARDLEESIGLALSARRFEVQRLELRLSIGSFAAAIGAMLAGIFGMNLRSTLEESIIGFWGTTAAIIFGCCFVYWQILQFTRKRKILG